jgi:hypothetical protein
VSDQVSHPYKTTGKIIYRPPYTHFNRKLQLFSLKMFLTGRNRWESKINWIVWNL